MIMSLKQREIKFKPRIKLNHNIIYYYENRVPNDVLIDYKKKNEDSVLMSVNEIKCK